MAKSGRITVRIPDPVREIVDAFCLQHDANISVLAFRGLMREIGRPDLIELAPKMGRPRLEPKKPAKKAAKKKRRA